MQNIKSFSLVSVLVFSSLTASTALAAGPVLIELKGVSIETVDPVFSDSSIAIKQNAANDISEKTSQNKAEIDPDFDLASEAFSAVAPELDSDRTPASAKKKPGKVAKSTKKGSSRLPSSATDGFELRVRQGEQLSRVWVVKRGIRHDLLFVNSSGSQATHAIPQETFTYLQSAAYEIKKSKSEISRCPASSMQLYVVQAGKPDKTHDACIMSKTKSAAGIRTLSGLVASFIR